MDELLRTYAGRIADVREFARRNRVVLLETNDRIGIDVSLAALPFEEEVIDRASLNTFALGFALRTCSAQDPFILEQSGWLSEGKQDPRLMTELARIRNIQD